MSVSTFTGAKAIGTAIVTGTTGSPTVDTSSRPGKTIYKFTGSGTITVQNGGMAEILIIGGGGGGSQGGGGAGGYYYQSSLYIAAGTQTVTIGAGGAGKNYNIENGISGNASICGIDFAPGGGGGGAAGGGSRRINGASGGSGGGGAGNLDSVGGGAISG
jgi:hypothetical protein